MNKKKFWERIKLAFLLFTFVVGGVFIYQWWNREQKLKELETRLNHLEKEQKEASKQYQLQQQKLSVVNSLVHKKDVQKFFTDLLTIYAKKFADKQELNISNYPLTFGGFYNDKKNGSNYGEMGRCSTEKDIYPTRQKTAKISLNSLYLLNKLGQDKYFTSNPQHGDYTYLNISFAKMMETCCHEIAHYLQFVKYGRSSCESDLITNNGNYDLELAKEHKKFTQQIYEMVKNSEEYTVWESQWKEY